MHVEIFAQAGEVEADVVTSPFLSARIATCTALRGKIRGRHDPVGAQVDLRERLQDRGDIGVVGAELFCRIASERLANGSPSAKRFNATCAFAVAVRL